MVFVENNMAWCGNIVGMHIINYIAFGMRFETEKDAWVSSRVKFLSMGFECADVTQASKNT